MTTTPHTKKILASLGIALLLGASMVLVLRSGPAAQADAKPALDFPAMKPVTPQVLDSLPSDVRERLSYYEASRGNLARHRGEETIPKVTEYGQVDSVSLTKVGDSICAFIGNGVGICDEESRIADDGAVAFAPQGCDSFELIGIAVEGVEKMSFTSDGNGNPATTIPVVSNVYSLSLDASRTSVRGFDEAGEVIFEDVIPLDEFAKSGMECQQ